MKLTTKRAILILLLLAPLAAYAAVTTAADRMAVAGDYTPNASGPNSAFKRMAMAGDFLPGGSGGGGAASATGSLSLMGVGK